MLEVHVPKIIRFVPKKTERLTDAHTWRRKELMRKLQGFVSSASQGQSARAGLSEVWMHWEYDFLHEASGQQIRMHGVAGILTQQLQGFLSVCS